MTRAGGTVNVLIKGIERVYEVKILNHLGTEFAFLKTCLQSKEVFFSLGIKINN